MAAPTLADGTLSFRGGSQDSAGLSTFRDDEARILENVRVLPNGAVEVRGGSKRLHASSLGSGGYGGAYFEPTVKNGVLVKAGLAISGEDAKTFKTTAAISYRIGSKVYEKAATDKIAFSNADTITANKYGVWLVQIDHEGTITTKAPATNQEYETADDALDDLPAADSGNVALGSIVVAAGGGGFTANTTALTGIATFADAKTVANGAPQLVVFVGSKGFVSEDNGETWTEIASGLPEAYWTFATLRIGDTLHLACVNGGKVYTWNGALADGWAELDNAPEGATVATLFNERLYLAGHNGNIINGSAIRDPKRWDTPWGVALQIAVHDGDGITAMTVAGPVLLIGKRRSIAWMDGFGNSDIIVGQGARGISRTVGCVAFRSMIPAGDDAVLWLSERGIEIYTGGSVKSASDARRMFFRDEVNWDEIEANPGRVQAIWYPADNQYWIALPTVGHKENRAILSVNLTTGSIEEIYRNHGDTKPGDPATMFVGRRSEVYFVGDDGFVRRFDTGPRDDVTAAGSGGTSFTARIRSRPFPHKNLFTRKRVRILDVIASHPDGASIRVRALGDDKPGPWTSAMVPASSYEEPEQVRVMVQEEGLVVAHEIETEAAGLRIHAIRMASEELKQVV